MNGSTRESYIETNSITLHVLEAGPKDGPLVILLHGFPDFWYGWRNQIEHLVAQGYRVMAPDQRGYNLSDKPMKVSDYALDELAQDIIGLIAAVGRQSAMIVAHDWGAAVAWWLASKYPSSVDRLCVMNVPHYSVMRRHLMKNPRQMLRSWYIFVLQVPWLAEKALAAMNCRFAKNILLKSSRPGTFSSEDIKKYQEAWTKPNALQSMVNWYRAAVRHPSMPPKSRRISVPTLLIWGAKDIALGRELARPSIEYCDEGRLIMIEEAGHWVQNEEPTKVNALLTEFLSG